MHRMLLPSSRWRSQAWLLSLLAAGIALSEGALAQPTFEVVGSAQVAAGEVSPDGQVVGLNLSNGGAGTVRRWEGGASILITSSSNGVRVGGLSEDGDVIVGSVDDDEEAFRWVSGSGLTFLAPLAGDDFMSASDVTHDGATSVGVSTDLPPRNTAWLGDFTTTTPLPDLAGGADSARARAISASGAVVVGQGTDATGSVAVAWTGGVPASLGDLPGGAQNSLAHDVSDDGLVVVGQGTTAGGTEAFRWEGGAMLGLGALPGDAFSVARGVSGDGSVVVGRSGNDAFVWTEEAGMFDLEPYLAGLAVDLGYVELHAATGISSDGTVIVGEGFDDDLSQAVVWRVSGLPFAPLPLVPALPGWGGLAVLAGLATAALFTGRASARSAMR